MVLLTLLELITDAQRTFDLDKQAALVLKNEYLIRFYTQELKTEQMKHIMSRVYNSYMHTAYSIKTRKFLSLPHILTRVLCGVGTRIFKFR